MGFRRWSTRAYINWHALHLYCTVYISEVNSSAFVCITSYNAYNSLLKDSFHFFFITFKDTIYLPLQLIIIIIIIASICSVHQVHFISQTVKYCHSMLRQHQNRAGIISVVACWSLLLSRDKYTTCQLFAGGVTWVVLASVGEPELYASMVHRFES